MRHGTALDVGQQGVQRDAERPLSLEGRQKAKDVARGLKVLKVQPTCIATSNLIRARQTAEIVGSVLGKAIPIEGCRFLEPGAVAADLLDWLRTRQDLSVLVVGHLPDLAEIASELLCGHTRADMQFKKAAVCCLVFDKTPSAGTARLEWLLQPRHLLAAANE